MKKICIVTGSRAEYSLLYWLIKRAQEDPTLEMQLLVTCMHLAKEFGSTYQNILSDGFEVAEYVDMLLVGDSAESMSKSFGIGVMGFTEALKRLQPDRVIVLGDRYEILALAVAAKMLRIPIAHIHGGEATEGALDESFRHCITKLSTFHFASTERYRQRIIQLGEDPKSVFFTGALGVDNIKLMNLLNKDELSRKLNFNFTAPYLLVTYHPETANIELLESSLENLLLALEDFQDFNLVFTKSNADQGGRYINDQLEKYANRYPKRVVLYPNLGTIDYLSALKFASVVVGNSSSGIIEAPSLKTPTVNIGERQKGRLRDASIIDCKPQVEDIQQAVLKGLDQKFLNTAFENPSVYEGIGEGASVAERILNRLKTTAISELSPSFYDLEFENV